VSTYWKFLRPGRLSPFARYPWPAPGEWVEADGVAPCRRGVHACRPADLPYWLLDELWQVELAGPVQVTPTKVVARRGRLVARVDAWNPDVAREFSWACVVRTAGYAVAELAAAGLAVSAAELTGAMTGPDPLGEAATAAAREAEAAGRDTAHWLSTYLVEAVGVLTEGPVAAVAYIADRAARHRSARVDPLAERRWQAGWLAERLDLPAD
jgi:hypothetical protein